jgi:adenosine deaminase
MDYVSLPKAELHSHLGGTVRRETLLSLLSQHAPEVLEEAKVLLSLRGDLSHCFQVFPLIHKALCTEDTIYQCILEAMEDAMGDGVRYLELRTTPRALRRRGEVKQEYPKAVAEACLSYPHDAPLHSYVSTVVAAITAGGAQFPRIAVRLLLSMDRSAPPQDWEAVARVAQAWSSVRVMGVPPFPAQPTLVVVGVDVSGHPGKGSLHPLLPLLDGLRQPGKEEEGGGDTGSGGKGVTGGAGCTPSPSTTTPPPLPLKVSIHLGEVENDAEVAAVLAWNPHRVGHMCVVAGGMVEELLRKGPHCPVIELCPTSNVVTLKLPTLKDHPLMGTWLASSCPTCICSDDVGVFQTSLSMEYQRAALAFSLDDCAMRAMAAASFGFGFARNEELEAASKL